MLPPAMPPDYFRAISPRHVIFAMRFDYFSDDAIFSFAVITLISPR